MLFINHDTATGQVRLIIRNPFAKAWIMHYPRLTEDFRRIEEPHDWRLYVQRAPELPPSAGKSPTSLLIVNLAKAEISRENARLIGAFIISQLVLAATARMSAIAQLEQEDPTACLEQFPDFYLYIEEFQDLATAKFDEALSQSRGGRLSLSLFNQYQGQLSEQVRSAVFGNVGSLISFGIGAEDAERLSAEFDHELAPEQLTGLREYEIALKLPQKPGRPTIPFKAYTLPIDTPGYGKRRRENVIRQSRERYGRARRKIEATVHPFLFASERAAGPPPPKKRAPRKETPKVTVINLGPEPRVSLSDEEIEKLYARAGLSREVSTKKV